VWLPQPVEKSAHKKTFQPLNRHKSVGDDSKARPSDCLLKRSGDAQGQALARMEKRLETPMAAGGARRTACLPMRIFPGFYCVRLLTFDVVAAQGIRSASSAIDMQ
jgi:hypothetical protein